jgi:hypothetical protein
MVQKLGPVHHPLLSYRHTDETTQMGTELARLHARQHCFWLRRHAAWYILLAPHTHIIPSSSSSDSFPSSCHGTLVRPTETQTRHLASPAVHGTQWHHFGATPPPSKGQCLGEVSLFSVARPTKPGGVLLSLSCRSLWRAVWQMILPQRETGTAWGPDHV